MASVDISSSVGMYSVLLFVLCLVLCGYCNSTGGIPQWEKYPRDVNTTVGKNVIFHCSLSGLDINGPLPRWECTNLTGGTTNIISMGTVSYSSCCEVHGDFSRGEYNIHIKDVKLEHEGIWKCSHIQAEPQQRGATLRVKDYPRWKEYPAEVNATVGEDVSLNCSLSGLDINSPLPRWECTNLTNGTTNVISRGNVSFSPCCEVQGYSSLGEYNLHIKNIQLEDGGFWKCAHILARPQTKGAVVRVNDKEEGSVGFHLTVSPSFIVITAFATIILAPF